MKKEIRNIILLSVVVLGIIFLSQVLFKRFDLTKDKRYTLTNSTKEILKQINEPLKINLLLGGDLTGDYRILKNEIYFILDEFQKINPNISFQFHEPTKDYNEAELYDLGISPIPIKTSKGALNIYPYAQIEYGEKLEWMETLINDPTISLPDLPIATTEKLEYLFIEEIQKITRTNRKSVGFLVHHDELPEQNIASLGRALYEKYNVDIYLQPIIDSSFTLKYSDIDSLKKFDALIIAKPTLPFSDLDKIVLDQYIMNGGKTLWMTESVDAEMDSIFRSERIVSFPRDLELNEFFFNYGIRIIPVVVKDSEGAKILLADGETTAGNISYNYYTWPYFVRGFKAENSPITESVNAVKFEFANPIEILENPNIKPTVLLASSPYSSLQAQLSFIELSEIQNMNPEEYQLGRIPLAVLLEGDFQSAYASKFERSEIPNFKNKTTDGKMIVVSDGDLGKNHILMGRPMPLGADKYSLRPDNPKQRPITYDNQAFLLNSLDYLLGETDFLYLRNRKLSIPTLDNAKVESEQKTWQWINLLLPLILINSIGALLIWRRKRKFAS